MTVEWKLTEGDYVPDGKGGFTALTGSGEVLARVLYRLTARRGALPFLPGLGSRLYLLGREKPSARQALAGFFGGRLLGRAVLLAELGNRLYELEGVEKYRFTAPAEDLPADSTVLPVLGTLEVTELGGGA